jgi:excinuclease UvrABC ATPase subunit
VIVVEHDEDAIRLADHVLDIGPGAGMHGGHIVAQGTPADIMRNPDSLTANISQANWRSRFRSGGRRTIAAPSS